MARVRERRDGAGGVSLTFDASEESVVADLAAREATCCGFLDLSVEPVGDQVCLTITSEADGAEAVIAVLAGGQP